jgi:hypothetical protein
MDARHDAAEVIELSWLIGGVADLHALRRLTTGRYHLTVQIHRYGGKVTDTTCTLIAKRLDD